MDETERKALIDGIKAAVVDKLKTAEARITELEQKFAGESSYSRGPIITSGPFATDELKSRINLLCQGHKSTGRIPLTCRSRLSWAWALATRLRQASRCNLSAARSFR